MKTAANLISEESDILLKRGENATLIRWAGHLPDQVVKENPALSLKFVWALALSGQENEAESYLKIVETEAEHNQAIYGSLLTAQIHIAGLATIMPVRSNYQK